MKPLNSDMLDLLRQCPLDRYFVAADLSWSRPGPTGSALTKLAERGLLKRTSDPTTWGRCRYALTGSGVAARWGINAASGMEARQGGNEVSPRSGDSPTPKGDAQGEQP
jgi:hypothetical protein